MERRKFFGAVGAAVSAAIAPGALATQSREACHTEWVSAKDGTFGRSEGAFTLFADPFADRIGFIIPSSGDKMQVPLAPVIRLLEEAGLVRRV